MDVMNDELIATTNPFAVKDELTEWLAEKYKNLIIVIDLGKGEDRTAFQNVPPHPEG
ncbi:hypothetical protein [Paenibacillus ehimensis]|uniref:hypothetical protein n=1 Tax=Paenibacillus ehimensis TaxID=79264 RepID=UPI000A6F7905|nr:hypothetical protein [Paenibacillus ehimensis]